MSDPKDEKIEIHIDLAEQDAAIPDKQGNGVCPDCHVKEEIAFGLAGGGYGTYGFCPECFRVLWKVQRDE